MAYVLLNSNTGETAVMGHNTTFTIGRSRMNSLLLKDKSCSREHAVIKIKNGYATILDIGSKRGTCVNTAKINDETKLQTGDVILFGLKNCKYRFVDSKFQTVVDNSVSENVKVTLNETLTALNIQILENYLQDSCTHYTTKVINLDTLKNTRILDALIDGKPIVTPKFWIDMETSMEIPNIYRYEPKIEHPLKDEGVHNILHKRKRHELFKDKLFIYYDKTLDKRLEHLIWKCAGEPMQHNNEADFATQLVEGMEFEFSEVIIITAEPKKDTTSLTKSYFIDKLRQYHKTVQELSEDNIYKAIFEGCFESHMEQQTVECGSSQVPEDDSAEQDRCPNHPGTSKSSINEQQTQKRTSKSSWTTLNRWIGCKKTSKVQAESTAPAERAAPAEKGDEFDISLDMSDDDTSEEVVRELRNTDINKRSSQVVEDDSSEQDMFPNQPGTSKSSINEQPNQKKTSKTSLSTSNRSIQSRKTSKVQAKRAAPAEKGDEFDISLDMSDDDTSEELVTELRNSDMNKTFNQTKMDAFLHITKPNQTKVQVKHKTKKNRQDLPVHVIVIEDSSSEEMLNDEIENQLNPSTSHGRSEERGKPIESSRGANNKENNSKFCRNPEIECVKPLEDVHYASNKENNSLNPEMQRTESRENSTGASPTHSNSSSSYSPEVPRRRIINNPFSKRTRASIPKLTTAVSEKNMHSSDTERPPTQTKVQVNHDTKQNAQDVPRQVAVVEILRSKEIEKRLNPSTSRDRSEKSAQPMERSRGASNKENNSKSCRNPEIECVKPLERAPTASNKENNSSNPVIQRTEPMENAQGVSNKENNLKSCRNPEIECVKPLERAPSATNKENNSSNPVIQRTEPMENPQGVSNKENNSKSCRNPEIECVKPLERAPSASNKENNSLNPVIQRTEPMENAQGVSNKENNSKSCRNPEIECVKPLERAPSASNKENNSSNPVIQRTEPMENAQGVSNKNNNSKFCNNLEIQCAKPIQSIQGASSPKHSNLSSSSPEMRRKRIRKNPFAKSTGASIPNLTKALLEKNIHNSNTESAPTQTKIQVNQETKKKRQDVPCQVAVIENTKSEEIEKRLNPSTSRNRSEKRTKPMESSRGANNKDNTTKSCRNPEIDCAKPIESSQRASPKHNNSNSSSSPEIQRKRTRINPFAKPASSSTPIRRTKETELNPELQQLRALFQDVEFEPL